MCVINILFIYLHWELLFYYVLSFTLHQSQTKWLETNTCTVYSSNWTIRQYKSTLFVFHYTVTSCPSLVCPWPRHTARVACFPLLVFEGFFFYFFFTENHLGFLSFSCCTQSHIQHQTMTHMYHDILSMENIELLWVVMRWYEFFFLGGCPCLVYPCMVCFV